MEFSKKEVILAISFSESVQFMAKMVNEQTRELAFDHTPYPASFSEDMIGEIDFVIQYYFRQVFNGDLDPEEPLVGAPVFDDPIDDLNFKLDHYKPEFILELKKTLEVQDARTMNNYAQEMLKFAVEKKKKTSEKETK
ncbi:MAG: hypothetical protein QNL04_08025 [SAR324 cluster bacterium]|nr:hypothetical protein [SAR324 cluster bacterium]